MLLFANFNATDNKMINELQLEIKKVKRSWCICAGKSVLGKFRTEYQAKQSLEKDACLYHYYKNSVSVCVENTEPVIIYAG